MHYITFITTYVKVGMTTSFHLEDWWIHKTNLSPPLFSEVPVQSKESERFYVFQRFFYVIVELFSQCGTFSFHFIKGVRQTNINDTYQRGYSHKSYFNEVQTMQLSKQKEQN